MWLKRVVFILLCSFAINSCAENDYRLHDSAGHLVKAASFKNKWLIVNYWADWCESCIVEIPELNKFYQHNQDKNILMFGVNYDQLPQASLQQSIQKAGIIFPVLIEDPSQLWKLGDVSVLPMTFIISPEGIVVRKIIGQSTEQSLTNILNTYMDETDSTKNLRRIL